MSIWQDWEDLEFSRSYHNDSEYVICSACSSRFLYYEAISGAEANDNENAGLPLDEIDRVHRDDDQLSPCCHAKYENEKRTRKNKHEYD